MLDFGIAKAKRMDTNEWTRGYIFRHDKFRDGSEIDTYLITTADADPLMESPVEFRKVHPETVCFYTLRKDDNNVEIFTDDITETGLVIWEENASAFCLRKEDGSFWMFELGDGTKIIGNAFNEFGLSKKELKALKKGKKEN